MSKAKDRARAELGLIFRDGKLVKKEDWYKTHPTKEMQAQQQVVVDAAVKDEMVKRFIRVSPLEQHPVIVRPDKLVEVPDEQPYFCEKCQRTHKVGTKIYKQHIEHYRFTV